MNLAAILAAKKAGQNPPPVEEKKEEEDKQNYYSSYTGNNYPRTKEEVNAFLLPFIFRCSFPYLSYVESKEVQSFLTTHSIVLNTFTPIDVYRIHTLYMERCPPFGTWQKHMLLTLLFDLSLHVPEEYQEQIEATIKRKFPLTKNPEHGTI